MKKWACISAIFSFIYVLLYVSIGFFAFPIADDYVLLNLLRENGFWLTQYEWYISLTGRYAYAFLISALILFDRACMFFTACRFFPMLWIALSSVSIYFCIKSIFPGVPPKRNTLISLFFQALWLSQMPSLNDSLYWLAGTPYYITCSVVLFATGIIAKLLRGESVVFCTALLSLLAFFNSGMIEIGAIFLLMELLAVFLFCVYMKEGHRAKPLILPLIFCALGLCAVYFAPGTAARFQFTSEAFGRETRNLSVFLKMTIIGGIPFSLDVLLSPLKYSLLLLLPDILPYVEKQVTFTSPLKDRLKICHAVVLTVVGAFCFQAITAYAFASPLPPRGESTATWALWFCWIVYFVFLYRDRAMLSWIKGSFFYRVRYALILVCFLLSFNTRDVISSLYNASDYYSSQMFRRSIMLNTPGDGTSYVPMMSEKNRLLHMEDDIGHKTGTSDGSSWANPVIAEYYGVRDIYGIPKILYDKGVISDFSDEEYLDELRQSAAAGDAYSAFSLARIYDVGRLGVNADVEEALIWYERAFEGGESLAVRSLFRIYLMDGRRTPDYKKAARYGLRYLFNKYVLGM